MSETIPTFSRSIISGPVPAKPKTRRSRAKGRALGVWRKVDEAQGLAAVMRVSRVFGGETFSLKRSAKRQASHMGHADPATRFGQDVGRHLG